MSDYGRTQAQLPQEVASRKDILREIAKTERRLRQANALLGTVSDPAWQAYRDYLIAEVLRPAEDQCRKLSPFTETVLLQRAQVIVEVVAQIISEPQQRGNEGMISKLNESLTTLRLRLQNAVK